MLRTKLILIWTGLAACAAWPQSQMPSWLAGYPDAVPQVRSSALLVESTYEVSANRGAVMDHYRKLFEAAGLAWHPNLDGVGTVIRAAAPECDLLLKIREQGTGTWVRVSCATKAGLPTVPAAPAIPAATPKAAVPTHETARKRIADMEKYDQPYRPPPRPPAPRLVWPAWLVGVDGAPLTAEKGVDQFHLNYLKSTYRTVAERNAVLTFYADLLNTNGYPVSTQTVAAWPRERAGWAEATYYPGAKPGPRIVIRVEVTPEAEIMRVEVRMTAHQ
jgi:hypothetical protein